MSTPDEIRLGLFGRPTLEATEGSVLLSPMQWALVGLVYGEPMRRLGRETLARFLWSDGSQAATRRRLSQLLYEVEQRVGRAVFLKAGASIRPNPEVVLTDLDAFYESVHSEELGTAAQLLSLGFLNGLPEIPTAQFDRWIDQRTAVLRADLRKRATERWVRAEDEALWNRRTRDAAEALLYLNPRSEAALRRSMWAQAMCGSPHEALATLEGFVEMNGLGSEEAVDEETRALVERVRALSRHRRRGQVSRPGPSRADPTLYGREGEVAALLPILAGPVVDGITVVAVGGEAGLGKTRLVRECLEPAMLQGRLILQTVLAELERDIPLNALIEAMSTQDIARALVGLGEPWRSVLLNLMPKFASVVGQPGPLPYVQPASLQRRLLESVRLLVDEVVRDQPVLMFIDNFHWADDSSLAALEYIRRRWSAGSLVLVISHRPEHVATGSALANFLQADSVHNVALRPIGDVAQKQLVREAAGGDVPEHAAECLRDLGGGNPLFLIELARQWSDGKLELPRRAIDPIRLPGTIQQLFARRLQGLGSEATRMLEALSVLAKRVPVSVLRTVSRLDEIQVTNGLEPLDRAGLLRWTADGVEVWHGLVQQAVLSRTSEARLRSLHEAVARYLMGQGEAEPDEIALHFDRARMTAEAFAFALSAADQAEEVGAVPEALFFLHVCERNAAPKQRFEILRRLAGLYYRQCDYAAALESGEALLTSEHLTVEERMLLQVRSFDCSSHRDLKDASARLGLLRRLRVEVVSNQAWEALALLVRVGVDFLARTDQVAEVPHLLSDVETCLRSEDPRVRCVAHQAGFLLRLYDQDVATGRMHGENALQIAKEHALADLLPRSYLAQVINLHLDGCLESAAGRKLRDDALGASARLGDLHSRFKLTSNLAAFYLDVGDQAKAESYLAVARGVLDEVDLGAGSAYFYLNCADLAIQQGEFAKAEDLGAMVLPKALKNSWYGWAVVFAILGRCALETGRLAKAQSFDDQLMDAWPTLTTPLVDLGLVTVFRARLHAARGNLPRAIEGLREAEETLERVNLPQFLRVRHARVRFLLRIDRTAASILAGEGFERCEGLGLSVLAERFRGAHLNASA